MRSIVVFGSQAPSLESQNTSVSTIEIDGFPVTVGEISSQPEPYDMTTPNNAGKVFVKVRAFSCNYRDKALILAAMNKGRVNSFYALGSEFVGEVVGFGPAVTGFAVGDRVIGNNHYVGYGVSSSGVAEGIPTNHASKEWQVFHPEKLVKIPPQMPDHTAAAFSIGAQTAYSMLRKLDLTPSARVMVTSARSNTALFVINALRQYDLQLYALSTSARCERELKAMGVKELIVVDPADQGVPRSLAELTMQVGPFDCVIDPFFDLYLGRIMDFIAPGGRYISCGLARQHPLELVAQPGGRSLHEVMTIALYRNIKIIGNCLGWTQDLLAAIDDYASGRFDVLVDSVFGAGQVGAFFDRTYNAADRFGKVVYRYD